MLPCAQEYVLLHHHGPHLVVSLIEIANTAEHPHTALQIYTNSIAVTNVCGGMTPLSFDSGPSESSELRKSIVVNDSGVLCM